MTKKPARQRRWQIPETDRVVAGKVLIRLARHKSEHFRLSWCYGDDVDFILGLAQDLGLPPEFPGTSLMSRLRRVVRALEQSGVLWGRVGSCHAEDPGGPRTLKSYFFTRDDYSWRLAPDLHPNYTPMGLVETELDFLLDRAYPEKG